MIIRNFVFFAVCLFLLTGCFHFNKIFGRQTPTARTGGRLPASAVCDYDPNKPLVGCWYKVLPKESGHRIVNIKKDGTWYDGYIANMEAGNPLHVGPIKKYSGILEVQSKSLKSGRVFMNYYYGPFYYESCNVLKLDTPPPYEILPDDSFSTNPQIKMTFIRLNTKFLASNLFSDNPPWFNQLYPDKDNLFNNCSGRSFVDNLTLENLILYGLPSRAILKLLPKLVVSRTSIPYLGSLFQKRPPLILGKHKSLTKWKNRYKRGSWTTKQIRETYKSREKYSAENKVNKQNTATRYYNKKLDKSIVVDDVTGEILQLGKQGFKN